jgi:hypothetical protein
VYATVDDMRLEGVTPSDGDDARVLAALEEASRLVDQLCGWFFEPRALSLRIDGRGTPTLWLPFPPIQITRLEAKGAPVSRDPENLVVVGAPALPGNDGPRLTRVHGIFPRGSGCIFVEGLFGFTEPDGTAVGRVPRAIRRATLLIAIRSLAALAGEDSSEARSRHRVIEERTRDQAIRFAEPVTSHLTGDEEIDRLLLPYARPRAMGAA